MAIPSSGSISLSTIQGEFGGSNPIGLNEYYLGGSYCGYTNTASTSTGTFDWNYSSNTYSRGSAPVNITYRRRIYQTIYTATELSNGGVPNGAIFTSLKWYVYEGTGTTYAIQDMRIRLFNTDTTNPASNAVLKSGTSKVDVFYQSGDFTYGYVSGDKTIPFSTYFRHTGGGICVETCTSQNLRDYRNVGRMRAVLASGAGGRYRETDSSGNSCGDTPNSTANYKISTQMFYYYPPNIPSSGQISLGNFRGSRRI